MHGEPQAKGRQSLEQHQGGCNERRRRDTKRGGWERFAQLHCIQLCREVTGLRELRPGVRGWGHIVALTLDHTGRRARFSATMWPPSLPPGPRRLRPVTSLQSSMQCS